MTDLELLADDRLLIAGQLVAGAARMGVINPATGQPFMSVGRASTEQLDDAVAAARASLQGWWRLGYAGRAERLIAFADAIHAEADAISRAIVAEQGKPLGEATGEVAMAEMILRYFAEQSLAAKVLKEGPGVLIEAHYRPLGVVAGISPWNFPVSTGLAKAAMALIVGNAFIWKPAPTTPVSPLLIARIAQPIFPAGVFSVITDNNDLGAAISGHDDIDKISFTGSTATGSKIMATAAKDIKRLTLELGGNDAALILEDADIADIAAKLYFTAFYNAGQVCVAVKRIYAHQSLYDQLCDALAGFARQAKIGGGTTEGVQIGPVQNAAQFAKAKDYLAVAGVDGRIIAGGHVVEGNGYFVEPTIVRDIDPGSRLVTEEQFAPILPVMSYQDLDKVIDQINDTPFGLGASVWGGDQAQAKAVAMRLDAGTVWVNQHMASDLAVPFGGAKQSGMGVELGQEGLAAFAQLHIINVAC